MTIEPDTRYKHTGAMICMTGPDARIDPYGYVPVMDLNGRWWLVSAELLTEVPTK